MYHQSLAFSKPSGNMAPMPNRNQGRGRRGGENEAPRKTGGASNYENPTSVADDVMQVAAPELPFSAPSSSDRSLPRRGCDSQAGPSTRKVQRRSAGDWMRSRRPGSRQSDLTSPSRRVTAEGEWADERVLPPSRRATAETADPPEAGFFRRDYALGESLRDPSHAVAGATPELAARAVDALRRNDFAFVKRSDGSWSYAALTDRSVNPIKGEGMTFVMNGTGSTKVVRRRYWGECVRLVAAEGPEDDDGYERDAEGLDPLRRRPAARGSDDPPAPVVLCREIPAAGAAARSGGERGRRRRRGAARHAAAAAAEHDKLRPP